MYMSSIGMKIGGRPVQVLKEDEASDPKSGLDKAKKLVEHPLQRELPSEQA